MQSYLLAEEPDAAGRERAKVQADFLEGVVRNEDYSTGLALQQAAANGAKKEFLFGRNEGGNQRFHQWVDRILGLEDPELGAAFVS